MFAKSKCFMVLRTGRYVQSRSIRKNSSQLKYSTASIEGLSSLKGNPSSHHFNSSEVEGGSSEEYLNDRHGDSRLLVHKKAKLDELISRAEDLLEGCRFHRLRTSPIGVGLCDPDKEPYFNLLPSWFRGEGSLIASKIPELLGSGHPILRLKKNLDPDDKEHGLSLLSNNVQWRAFVMLMVSKALGLPLSKRSPEFEARLKTLAEITEMMHFAFSMHRTIVEIKHSSEVAMEEKETSLQLGNKIAILFGDLLLSRTSKGLSALKNHKVTEIMSDAISDFTESEVLRRRHYEFFEPVLENSGRLGVLKEQELVNLTKGSSNRIEVPSLESWKKRVNLDIASLMARSCLCSTLLSHHDEGASNLAFNIGQQIGLVVQAHKDLESYNREKSRVHPSIDLCTLPVIFHLSSDSVERIKKPVDISEIYHGIMDSPEALIKSQNVLESLKAEALRLISTLPRSTSAPDILKEFVVTLN